MQAIQFYENLEDCDYFLLLENKNNPDATVFVVENGIIPPFQCSFPSELQHPFTISVKYGAINEGLLYEITSALTIKKLATATSKYVISSASADIAPLAEGRLFTIVVEATDGTNTYTKYSQVLCNTAQSSSAGGGVIWNPSPPPVYGYAQKIDSDGISLLKNLVPFANFKETGSQFIGKQPIFWRASEGVDSENDFKIEDAKIFKYVGGVWVEQNIPVDFENIDSDVKILNHGLYLTQNPGADTVGDERFILGKHQKYVAGAGWVDISVAGNGALTNFIGYWDANTNTPTIVSGDGTAGDWYLVDVAGTTEIDGLTPWGVGDVIWYDGDTGHWQMINNQTAAPTKPVGATGAVQIKGADGNFDWTTDLLFESDNRALALQRLRLYGGLSVAPIPGAVERDATDLYFTATDGIRRALAVAALAEKKLFVGDATGKPTASVKLEWDEIAETLSILESEPDGTIGAIKIESDGILIEKTTPAGLYQAVSIWGNHITFTVSENDIEKAFTMQFYPTIPGNFYVTFPEKDGVLATTDDVPNLNSFDGDIKLINQHAIYFLQTPGATTDGDVRIAHTGKFEEYNAASGTWIPIGSGAGLSTYKGNWNASTNTPALASGVGVEGDYYTVSVAGSTTLDGNSAWGVGDILFFKNTWFKIDNSVGSTLTVAGLNKQIQYNNNGVLGASSNFTFDTTVNKLYLNGVLDLPNTTSSTTGIITKNGNRFLHNFKHPTGGGAIPYGYNIFLGENAGNFTMGSTATSTSQASNNIGLGAYTLQQLTTGSFNLAFGSSALNGITTGTRNIGVGTNSLTTLTTGSFNLAIGSFTLQQITNGSNNVAIGHYSLLNLTSSNYNNIAIGIDSGRYIADGTTGLTSANGSLYLGTLTKASADGVSNENVFGYNTIGKGSNTVNIGNTFITDTYLNGKVHSTSSVQVANNSEVASAANVGSLRYRETANGSYTDMCMKTGASTWAWVNIKQNTW